MIIVEPRRPNKSLTITIVVLTVATIFAVLLTFLVRARAEGPHPRDDAQIEQAAGAVDAEEGEPGDGQDGALHPSAPDYDIIMRGGTLVGETRILGADADIGIRDGLIYAIGDLAGATAAKEVDAAGVKYAIVEGRLAFVAATEWAGDPPNEEEHRPPS